MPTFVYNGTALEVVAEFKYLGVLLRRDGKMNAATSQMARNMPCFGSFKSLHSQQAYTDAKYGLQTNFPFESSTKTKAHVYHTVLPLVQAFSSLFWVLRGQQKHAAYFKIRDRCPFISTGSVYHHLMMRSWNLLPSTNNGLLRRVVQADLRLPYKEGSWTYQALTALNDVPNAQQYAAAVRIRARINMKNLEGVLHEQIIHDWRSLDNLTPQEARASSRTMRTYHIHIGIPLGSIPGWWDERKRNKKPLLPIYQRQDIPHEMLRSISCLHLSGHNLRVETQRHHGNRCPYELSII
eukprot:1137553-Pelagomonas_calceolata.AAC.1